MVENPAMQDQVIVQDIPEVVERTQEPPVFVTAPMTETPHVVAVADRGGDIISDNFAFAQALVPLDTVISRHLGNLKPLNDRVSSLSSALLKRHAASLTPGNGPNIQGDNWRTTLFLPPTWYSASVTILPKSKVPCLRFFGSDNACLHYGVPTTASEDD